MTKQQELFKILCDYFASVGDAFSDPETIDEYDALLHESANFILQWYYNWNQLHTEILRIYWNEPDKANELSKTMKEVWEYFRE
jgi:hypothetical protein